MQLSDCTAYHSDSIISNKLIYEAGYVVEKLPNSSAYRIIGITIADDNFEVRNTSLDSFIDNYKRYYSSPDISVITVDRGVGFGQEIWRLGYAYYIMRYKMVEDFTGFNNLSLKLARSAKPLNFKPKLNDFVIVGLSTRNSKLVIASCLLNVSDTKGNTLIKSKAPVMQIKDLIDIYAYYNDSFEFKPYDIAIKPTTRGTVSKPVMSVINSCIFTVSQQDGIRATVNYDDRIDKFVKLKTQLAEVEGNFLKLNGYCTLNPTSNIGRDLIMPKDCKYMYFSPLAKNLNAGIKNIENVVFSSNVLGFICTGRYLSNLDARKFDNIKHAYFSKKTDLSIIFRVYFNIFSDAYDYSLKNTLPKMLNECLEAYKKGAITFDNCLRFLENFVGFKSNIVKICLY